MAKLGVVALVSTALLVGACAANDRVSVSGSIDRFGIASPVSEPVRRANPNAPGGIEYYAQKFIVTSQTDRIEARIGTTFGYQFTAVGLPERNDVRLRKVVKFPPMKLPDRSTAHSFETELGPFAVGSNRSLSFFEGYRFDDPFELVEGLWQIEIWFENRLLTTKAFKIESVDSSVASEHRAADQGPWHPLRLLKR